MTQFLLAVVYDHTQAYGRDIPRTTAEAFAEVEAFNRDLEESGRLVYACGLTPPADGVSVSPEGRLSDGPVRDGDVQLGGFWVVEVANRSAAEALAVRAASACGRPIELRALAE